MNTNMFDTRQNDYGGSGSTSTYTDIQTGDGGTDLFLSLIADPFSSQIQSTGFYAALIYSFGVGAALVCLFCFLRPRVSSIYAPRAKHADARHAPPPVGPGFLGWLSSLKAVREQELVEKIGLDATIFLRFLKMTRNIFLILTIIGCAVLIPVNLAGNHYALTGGSEYGDIQIFVKLTPQFIYGSKFWAFVVLAYVFNAVIFFFLWSNYRAITNLRRTYFQSTDYQASLHSRTLLITHIPESSRTEDGLVQLVQEGKPLEDQPKTSIARNAKELPQLIEQHEDTVQKLESVLAKYLANPDKLPDRRPLCKPSKHDKSRSSSDKVDAIDYLTSRISVLEREINQIRENVDRRNPHPYGFASYSRIEDAHSVAYATRKKSPRGTTIKLAPRPHDLIWRNLPMTRAARRIQAAWITFWIVVLTVLFIPPNVLVAVFLANLHNLGLVWSDFNASLIAHPTGWAIAQGIIAPGIQLLFYFFLPTIFRRLLIRAGDTSKTSRERHVMSKLYAFFVFNKLFAFSVFAAAFSFIATLVKAKDVDVWTAIQDGHLASKVTIGLCNISPYWITVQLQNNLGIAIDLLQAWPLITHFFLRKFGNPTPRQLVELTAPQPFVYADYYSAYLFVATVGLAFGTLQPLILPVTAFYLAFEAWFKKYMLQYIFITKVESGGAFWRTVFNRFLFAVLMMDAVIALVVGAQGYANPMLFAMIPLVPILAIFKWFCARSFDTKFDYYTTRSFAETESCVDTGIVEVKERKPRRNAEKVAVKFGNPALYRKLMTPMVHAKSQHLLKEIYRGRLEDESGYGGKHSSRPNSAFGYGDIYMNSMNSSKPGKEVTNLSAPFEIVSEADLDFENFKRRAEFREEYGGDGELYGRPEDQISRPSTPSSMLSFGASSTLMSSRKPGERSRSESPANSPINGSRDHSRSRSRDALNTHVADIETTYHRGYSNVAYRSGEASPSRGSSPASPRPYRDASIPRDARLDYVGIPSPGLDRQTIADAGLDAYRDDNTYFETDQRRLSQGSMGAMLANAQRMGRSPSPTTTQGRISRKPIGNPNSRSSRSSPLGFPQPLNQSQNHYENGARTGLMGGNVDDNEDISYDQFRRGRY